MQLSNKKIKNSDLEKELSALVKQSNLDLVVGSAQMAAGVFVLLFSHRQNKELGIVVTGNHEKSDVLKRVHKVLEQTS